MNVIVTAEFVSNPNQDKYEKWLKSKEDACWTLKDRRDGLMAKFKLTPQEAVRAMVDWGSKKNKLKLQQWKDQPWK